MMDKNYLSNLNYILSVVRFWPEEHNLVLFRAACLALETGSNQSLEAALLQSRQDFGDWQPMGDAEPALENSPLEWAVRRGVIEMAAALEMGDMECFTLLADAFHFLPELLAEGKPLYYADYRQTYILSQWKKPSFLKEMDKVFDYHKILRWRNPRIDKSR